MKTKHDKKLILVISTILLSILPFLWLLVEGENWHAGTTEAKPIADVIRQENLSEFSQGSPWLIPAAAFSDWGTRLSLFSADDGYVTAVNDIGACVMAPVYLPDDVLIQSFRVYAYDNHYQNLTINFRRKTISSIGSAELISFVTTTTNSSNVQPLENTANPALAKVDNENYSYYVDACLFTNQRIYAAAIAFITKTYLPVTMNNYCPFWWECEPNDDDEDAHGPLISGDTYYGSPDDHGTAVDSDYFSFNIQPNSLISITVNNFIVEGNVSLFEPNDPNDPKELLILWKGNQCYPDPCPDNHPRGTYTIKYTYTGTKNSLYFRIASAENHKLNTGNYNFRIEIDD